MSRNARDILESENELLEILAQAVDQFVKNYNDPFEHANLACWAMELRAAREVNLQYLSKNKDDLKAALESEASFLYCLTRVVKLDPINNENPGAADYWKMHCEENAKYTQGTADRV